MMHERAVTSAVAVQGTLLIRRELGLGAGEVQSVHRHVGGQEQHDAAHDSRVPTASPASSLPGMDERLAESAKARGVVGGRRD
jgi:hypothetical protein